MVKEAILRVRDRVSLRTTRACIKRCKVMLLVLLVVMVARGASSPDLDKYDDYDFDFYLLMEKG